MFFRDNVVDPWEMEQRTKLNEKQATAAVKVVSNNIKHQSLVKCRELPWPTNSRGGIL